jgi:uncharacterized Ntn-hydrolase superfamily protein
VTYSIVAREAATGRLGAAVQSYFFQVGRVVPCVEAGVGAVAAQALPDPRPGPAALARLRVGEPAPAVLTELLAHDPEAEARQIAIVDAKGEVAAHTGGRCIAYAGHHRGAGFSTQANWMAGPSVPRAMAEAFLRAEGLPLAERLLAALEAAEAEGGDLRGRMSAAIVVAGGRGEAQLPVDLRVDHHPDPLAELARLLRLQLAYEKGRRGSYREALKHAPEEPQIRFSAGLELAAAGAWGEALPLLADALAEPRWLETMRRLAGAGRLARDVAAEVERRLGIDGQAGPAPRA